MPLADQLGELALLRQEGKIRHIGLSQVGVEAIEAARAIAPIVSVQNLHNLADRRAEDVLARRRWRIWRRTSRRPRWS